MLHTYSALRTMMQLLYGLPYLQHSSPAPYNFSIGHNVAAFYYELKLNGFYLI